LLPATDERLQTDAEGEFVLHHHLGDKCAIDSFAPLRTILAPNASRRFVPAGGRPTNGEWPYYNLECPHEGKGVLIVLAWPGQWASQFQRDGKAGLRVVGGQELTRFKLRPGEEIRTPLVVLQFYQGDWDVRNKEFPFDHAKKFLDQWRSVVHYYFGDFYPLGEYSTGDGVWMAWQFDRPDLAAGLIQAFRRPNCAQASTRVKLRSLEPDARYLVSDLDADRPRQMSGRELTANGLVIVIPDKPGAALITYRKAPAH